MAEENKVCPFCAETIKIAAIKCRFCLSVLTSESNAQLEQNGEANEPKDNLCPRCKAENFRSVETCEKCGIKLREWPNASTRPTTSRYTPEQEEAIRKFRATSDRTSSFASIRPRPNCLKKSAFVWGIVALVAVIFTIYQLNSSQNPGNSFPDQNPGKPITQSSWDVGFNAGQALADQNTSLFPRRDSLCGDAFPRYSQGQNLDYGEFLKGCLDGWGH